MEVPLQPSATEWENFTGTLRSDNVLVFDVRTVDELAAVVTECQSRGLKIRAAAGWSDESPPLRHGLSRSEIAANQARCFNCCGQRQSERVEKRYNESFSWTPFAQSPNVIVRFAPAFHHVRVNVETKTARVTAGTTIGEIEDVLWSLGYSLSTSSMIPYVSAVGLAATGGHGTGLDQPSFAGLIRSLEIMDSDGTVNIVDRDHPDFDIIRGAHLGLFGIVVAMEIDIDDRYWLREIRTPLPRLEATFLQAEIRKHPYTTLIGIPTYEDESRSVCQWEIRTWDRLEFCPRSCRLPPRGLFDFLQHLRVTTGESIVNALASEDSRWLKPFMKIAALSEIGKRQQVFEHEARKIAHSQVSFPRGMDDISVLIPVHRDHIGRCITEHLQWINQLLLDYGSRGEFPVNLAIYVRVFAGTNGGLSTSATNRGEVIVAIEMATSAATRSWPSFRLHIENYFRSQIARSKFHLGKYIPQSGLQSMYGEIEWKEFLAAWRRMVPDGRESIFVTPYIRELLCGGCPPSDEKEEIVELGQIPWFNRILKSAKKAIKDWK